MSDGFELEVLNSQDSQLPAASDSRTERLPQDSELD
jgi:hypothetical protein